MKTSKKMVASKSVTQAILCILNGCHPKKPRCHKASGLFSTNFQVVILIDATRQKRRVDGI